MGLDFKSGDLFDSKCDALVNTVNCVGVMGAGIALSFKKRFPEMFKEYQIWCRRKRREPGDIFVWSNGDLPVVINLATKDHWRAPSRYEWIDTGLSNLRNELDRSHASCALPALGCNNGGLIWYKVKKLIQSRLRTYPNLIEVYKPKE